jgi:hypothetical protein
LGVTCPYPPGAEHRRFSDRAATALHEGHRRSKAAPKSGPAETGISGYGT